jgi:hypothetical protein
MRTRLSTLCSIKDHLEAVAKEPTGEYANSLLASCISRVGNLIKSEAEFHDYIRFTLGEAND